MEVTAEQRAALEHGGPRLAVAGGPGTGKTTVLRERWRRLVGTTPPSRVLVLCRDRRAADRFVDSVLPLWHGFDSLPVTTVYGLAHDLLARAGRARRLVGAAERRVRVRRMLEADDPAEWPRMARFLQRPAFAAEVAAALDVALAGGPASVDAAEAAGGAWGELARFARRWLAALEADGLADPSTLAARAAGEAAAARRRFDHVLVDDAADLAPAGACLVAALTAPGGPAVTAAYDPGAGAAPDLGAGAAEVELPRCFRAGPPGRLVCCEHPSLEAETVAGELLAERRQGLDWPAMAVLVPRPGRRARALARALARHGVPVAPAPALAVEEPLVAALADLLRWVDGDERALERLLVTPLAGLEPGEARALRRESAAAGEATDRHPRLAGLVTLRERLRGRLAAGDTAADLAYEGWASALARVDAAVDDRALDGLVAFVEGLAGHAVRHPGAGLGDTLAALDEGALVPDPWRTQSAPGPDGVTIATIAAAEGREWHTVVVTGCVEGELPRLGRGPRLFDPAVLGPGPTPLERERRRFQVAATRATGTLVGTAAPAPGVLLSRFVEAWPAAEPSLPGAPGQAAPARPVTSGAVPAAPGRRLRLSASQLATYDDCPLRYAYQYVLRVRDEPGVHAALGTLAHEVLAEFCDPASPDPPPRSLEGLLDLADARWSDDLARYRPQLEEARRDLVAMLTRWWECEGSQPGAEVVAVERRFDIAVGPHRLEGSIDRIERTGDGSLTIVDYKTGKSEPRPDDVADDLQLAVYHLAATRDEALAALGPPTRLELRYLRTMNRHVQPVADDHAERTEARVLAAAERILAEDFEPSVDATCRNCGFHRLCPIQPEGRAT